MLSNTAAQIKDLLTSPVFLACIFSWFSAQFIKTVIKLFSGKVKSLPELIELLLWRTGGMPSSHCALVSCLCTSIAFRAGLGSDLFILSFCFYMVTIRDSVGVRRANGIQAAMINRIGQKLKEEGFFEDFKKLKEIQGHTMMEALIGSLIGVFIGIGFSVL